MKRCRRGEYRKVIAVSMRGDGESVECVAGKLHDMEKTVSVWTTTCLGNGNVWTIHRNLSQA